MAIDDLRKGITVTVLRGKTPGQELDEDDHPLQQAVATMLRSSMMSPYDQLKGHPLRIDAVDVPYLAVTCLCCQRKLHIDVRECELGIVTEEYANARRPKSRWQFWK